jgi:prevent-host-death family protein
VKTVSVSELKAELSRYLRAVRRGGEVQILERGVPIARLVGMPAGSEDDERLSRLVGAGILKAGSGDARAVLAKPPVDAGADLGGALDEERGDRA